MTVASLNNAYSIPNWSFPLVSFVPGVNPSPNSLLLRVLCLCSSCVHSEMCRAIVCYSRRFRSADVRRARCKPPWLLTLEGCLRLLLRQTHLTTKRRESTRDLAISVPYVFGSCKYSEPLRNCGANLQSQNSASMHSRLCRRHTSCLDSVASNLLIC
jgi:hypothetical protein